MDRSIIDHVIVVENKAELIGEGGEIVQEGNQEWLAPGCRPALWRPSRAQARRLQQWPGALPEPALQHLQGADDIVREACGIIATLIKRQQADAVLALE